jgi:hypothetical protein
MTSGLDPAARRFLPWATLLLALFALIPLWTTRYPPVHDYPFHLARIVILSHLDDASFSRFYALGSFLLPNIGMDAVAVPLAHLLGAELAVRVFVGLTLMTALFGAIILHRAAHRRISPWPLLAVLLLHNGIFRYGFFNYLFGMGLALAAAGWWILQPPGLRRFAIALLLCILLMLCHFEALGIFAVISGSVEIEKAWRQWRGGQMSSAATGLLLAALPFLACLLLFVLLSPTASVASKGLAYTPGLGAKPMGGLFSLSSGNLWLDAIAFVAMAGVLAWLAVTRNLTLSPPLAVATVMMALAFFVVPFSIMGALYVDVRLGPAVALVALMALDIREGAPARIGRAVMALALGLGLLRSVQLAADWKHYEARIAPIAAAIQKIEPGSTLFDATAVQADTIFADTPERRNAWQPPLKHVSNLAVLGTQVFLPSMPIDPTQQPLNIRTAYRPVHAFEGPGPMQTFSPQAVIKLIADIRGRLQGWPALGPVYLLVVDDKRLWPVELPPGVTRAAGGDNFLLLRLGGTGTAPQ